MSETFDEIKSKIKDTFEESIDVKNTINFLSGDTKNVIIDLQKKMDFYSNKKDYERAAIYRDKVQSIRDTQKKQNVLTGFDDLDIIVIKRNKFNCCLSVLRIEDSWITSSQNFFPDSKEKSIPDTSVFSSLIKFLYEKDFYFLFFIFS